MRLGAILAGFFALLLHGAFLLFGGLLLPKATEEHAAARQVELVAEESEPEKKDPKKDKEKEASAEQEAEQAVNQNQDEPPPDAQQIIRSLESTEPRAPALELASLGAIEAALSGKGGGEFGDTLGFVSGGRIDGQGKGTLKMSEAAEASFSMAEIDQKPRAIYQAAPEYPAEMRGKKVEGVVTVLFVVDPTGKVTRQRVEQSTHPAFEKPALDAVRRWKFEPGIKGGQRVACRMRVSVRFSAGA